MTNEKIFQLPNDAFERGLVPDWIFRHCKENTMYDVEPYKQRVLEFWENIVFCLVFRRFGFLLFVLSQSIDKTCRSAILSRTPGFFVHIHNYCKFKTFLQCSSSFSQLCKLNQKLAVCRFNLNDYSIYLSFKSEWLNVPSGLCDLFGRSTCFLDEIVLRGKINKFILKELLLKI